MSIENSSFICKELLLTSLLFLFMNLLLPSDILAALLRLTLGILAFVYLKQRGFWPSPPPSHNHSPGGEGQMPLLARVLGLELVLFVSTLVILILLWMLLETLIPANPRAISESIQNPWLYLFLTLIAAASEELFFRGYMLRRLLGLGLKVPVSISLMAAVFCLGHVWGGPAALLFSFVAGYLLGLLSLWPRPAGILRVMIIHLAYNGISAWTHWP